MLVMAKRKKSAEPAEPAEYPISWRPDDPRLRKALDQLAKLSKRSRNMMITYLVEEACKAAGLWPPK